LGAEAVKPIPVIELSAMTPTDPHAPPTRAESALACSVILFSLALLAFMLGWAQGVRKDTTYLHIPENGSWLIATAILAGLALICLLFSRMGKRS
jgi:hypothetical protein